MGVPRLVSLPGLATVSRLVAVPVLASALDCRGVPC